MIGSYAELHAHERHRNWGGKMGGRSPVSTFLQSHDREFHSSSLAGPLPPALPQPEKPCLGVHIASSSVQRPAVAP